MIVTRKAIEIPSNSKSPGASHHVDIKSPGAIDSLRFAAAPEDRGSGIARCEVAAGPATINVSANFFTGKARRLERRSKSVPVIVTGDQADTVTVTVELAQRYTVQFWGVRTA